MSFASNFRIIIRQKTFELKQEEKTLIKHTADFWAKKLSMNRDRFLALINAQNDPEPNEVNSIAKHLGVEPDWFNEDHSNDMPIIKVAYIKGEEKELDDDFDETFEAIDYAKGINKKYNKN